MEDSWLCIDEDSISSHNSSLYSDQIGSDIEAELYSVIHHQENLRTNDDENAENICMQSSQITTSVIDANVSPADNENTEHSFLKSFRSNSQYDCNTSAKRYEKCSELTAQTIDRPLKRKSETDFENEDGSDSISLVEYSVNAKSSEFQLPTNKNTKKIKINSKTGPNKFEGNEVTPDSSDSDGAIWTEHDSSEKYNLTVNLHGTVETITISSDSSDNSLSFSSPITRNVWNNQSLPNIKLGENSKDPWHINIEDLYRSKKKRGRYHEHNDQQCSNCNGKDHVARFCPVRKVIKCVICGGAHLMAQCKNRMCLKCLAKGHDIRRCWNHSPSDCYHCGMKGHTRTDCPDIWRRYHLTTEPTGIVQGRQMKQNGTLYCFTCGCPGHFGPECKEKNVRVPSTWPCVISYNNPDDLLMNRLADVNQNFQPYDKLIQRDMFNRSQDNFSTDHNKQHNRNLNKGDTHHNKQLNRIRNNVDTHHNKQLNRRRNNIDIHHNKQLNRSQNNFATDHNKQRNRSQNNVDTHHNKQLNRSQNNFATDHNKQLNRSQNNVDTHHNKQFNRSQNNVDTHHNKQLNRTPNYGRKLTNMQEDLCKGKQTNDQETCSRKQINIQEEWSRKKKRSKDWCTRKGARNVVSTKDGEHNNMKVHLFRGIRKVTADKDFPRTPKSVQKDCIQDPIPDAAAIAERQRLRNKRRRARKLLNKRLRGENSLHEDM